MSPITRYRKAMGLSQEQLAEAIGVTQTTVSHWERGFVKPRAKHIKMLSDVLGIPGLELLKEV